MNRETVDLAELWQQYKLNNDLTAREKIIEVYSTGAVYCGSNRDSSA